MIERGPLDATMAQLRAIMILPTISGMVSAIGSMVIIYMIQRSYVKFSTTYHRILFGLACTGMISSISNGFSSYPVPKESGVLYASGNQTTCNIQGKTPLYNLLLNSHPDSKQYQKKNNNSHSDSLYFSTSLGMPTLLIIEFIIIIFQRIHVNVWFYSSHLLLLWSFMLFLLDHQDKTIR